MPWFTIDDKWHSHRKVVGISLAAAGLWARSGSWCGDHLTDGAVPRTLPKSWGATLEIIQELVDAGLWLETEAGWQFHQWLDRNPSREEILAKRKAEAERKARARAKPAKGKKLSARTPAGVQPESGSPSPSPSPIPKERERARELKGEPMPASELDTSWIRLGKLYKEIYDAEQQGSRNPRDYDENRITSTDARALQKLVELVRAESDRTAVGQREVFRRTATDFLRDSTQKAKGHVLEYFARDFHRYADRTLEAAS